MTHFEKIDWAQQKLRNSQVRMTPVRERVLAFLPRTSVPATLQGIGGSEDLADQFDGATVYRTMVLLVELEIVRQLQFQGRQTHFLLNTPGECFSFLICRCCGAITRIPHGDAIHTLEREMAALHGYAHLTHELELFGTCLACQLHDHVCQKPTKLLPGLRIHGRFRK